MLGAVWRDHIEKLDTCHGLAAAVAQRRHTASCCSRAGCGLQSQWCGEELGHGELKQSLLVLEAEQTAGAGEGCDRQGCRQ